MFKATKKVLLAGASALAILAASGAAEADMFIIPGTYSFPITTSGEYSIDVLGASGGEFVLAVPGGVPGGRGAEVFGDVKLVLGDVLTLVVGGHGGTGPVAGGGGGGSFITLDNNGGYLLAAAGGGGGAGYAQVGLPGLGTNHAGAGAGIGGGAGGTGVNVATGGAGGSSDLGFNGGGGGGYAAQGGRRAGETAAAVSPAVAGTSQISRMLEVEAAILQRAVR